tara:strand:- start:277 stop:1038 length:762 start_codon:yes stop_codon:yes gene_type:complete
MPLPLIVGAGAALVGGYATSRAARHRRKAIEAQKGPDIGKIRAELSPWSSKIQKMDSQAAMINAQGQGLMQQATQMVDPRGTYQESQTQMLNERLADQAQQTAQTQSQLMAQRGMGGGGLAGLLQATSGAQAGEQLRQGMAGIQDAGFQRSMQMRGQGMQMQGQANTLMNQAMNAQQAYSENMVRAQEASRQFKNQQASASRLAKAQIAEGWAGAATGIAGGALGQVTGADFKQLGQAGKKAWDWTKNLFGGS